MLNNTALWDFFFFFLKEAFGDIIWAAGDI